MRSISKPKSYLGTLINKFKMRYEQSSNSHVGKKIDEYIEKCAAYKITVPDRGYIPIITHLLIVIHAMMPPEEREIVQHQYRDKYKTAEWKVEHPPFDGF